MFFFTYKEQKNQRQPLKHKLLLFTVQYRNDGGDGRFCIGVQVKFVCDF